MIINIIDFMTKKLHVSHASLTRILMPKIVTDRAIPQMQETSQLFAAGELPKALIGVLISIFLLTGSVFAETFTGQKGKECVGYVRRLTGNNWTTSPALGSCTGSIPDPCGAWRIYDIWNYGFGKGDIPMPNSLFVIAHGPGNRFGHVGIVQSVEDFGNGVFELRVNESNWYLDQQIETNVRYRYDKNQMTTQREHTPMELRTGVQNSSLGNSQYNVRGFVYRATLKKHK